jgi:hypothetical protein
LESVHLLGQHATGPIGFGESLLQPFERRISKHFSNAVPTQDPVVGLRRLDQATLLAVLTEVVDGTREEQAILRVLQHTPTRCMLEAIARVHLNGFLAHGQPP